MSGVIGFQDFWVAGSRLLFQRDSKDGTDFPLIDLGTIQPANPSFDIEKIELFDSECGINQLVNERVNRIDETYDITCSNFNMDNLSILFLAETPTSYSQTQADFSGIDHTVQAGRLFEIVDNVADPVYNLAGFTVYSGPDAPSTVAVDSVTVSYDFGGGDIGSAIEVETDITGDLSNGDKIYLGVKNVPTAEIGNKVGQYTVQSVALDTGNTRIRLQETIQGSDIASDYDGLLYYEATGDTVGFYDEGADYEAKSLARGFARAIPGGSISSGTVKVIYSTNALSGNRTITPQSLSGEAQGEALLFWCRGNQAQESVRRCRVSLTPTQSTIQVDDYSQWVVQMKVVSDLTSNTPAGDLLYIKGDIPALS